MEHTTLLLKVKFMEPHNTFIESRTLWTQHFYFKVKLHGAHNTFIESKTLWSTQHLY